MTDRTWQEDLRQLIPEPRVLAAVVRAGGCFVWFYWSSIDMLGVARWWTQDDYQHGFVVPFFALFLLWLRRDMIIPFAGRGSWWGLAFLALWAVMRWAAVYFNFGSLPEMSMLPFFAGLALFVGGWQALRWAWPAIVFLVFMLPLPGDIQGLAQPAVAGHRHADERLCHSDLGDSRRGAGPRDSIDRQPQLDVAASVQRIADDDDVLRDVRRRGFRGAEAVVGEALDYRQRRSDRRRSPTWRESSLTAVLSRSPGTGRR